MPSLNSEWRIDRIRHLAELLQEADDEQLDMIDALIMTHIDSFRRRSRVYTVDSVEHKDPIIIGA